MTNETSTLRLYLIRFLFLLNFALLGLDVWPAIIGRAGTWDPVKGVAFSFWGALSLLSAIGLRYPLRMLPLLMMQLTYKLIWISAVALPQWATLQSAEITKAMVVGLILDAVVIPWPYVVENYVRARGDRWTRSRAGA